jgi:hypothetical protein
MSGHTPGGDVMIDRAEMLDAAPLLVQDPGVELDQPLGVAALGRPLSVQLMYRADRSS